MRILITGCFGQVGNALVDQLQPEANADKVVLLALGRDDLDITDQAAVNALINSFKPTVIINAAAYTAVDKAESEVERSYAINCEGPRNLAVGAQLVNSTLIHISTDYVFSGNKDCPYIETDMPEPQSVYGASKLAGEQAIVEACEKHIILRTAWVFGEHGNNFVKTMLRLARTHNTLNIVCDQFGGPTYAGDIAAALIKLSKSIANGDKQHYGIYHFSGLPYVNWSEFAHMIFTKAVSEKILNKMPCVNPIVSREYPTPAKRPANSKLDCKLIAKNYSIMPSDWESALDNIKFYSD